MVFLFSKIAGPDSLDIAVSEEKQISKIPKYVLLLGVELLFIISLACVVWVLAAVEEALWCWV